MCSAAVLSSICVSFLYHLGNVSLYRVVVTISNGKKSQELSGLIYTDYAERMDVAESIEHVDQSRNQRMITGWQFLGELELPVGSDAERIVHTWLTKSLDPLNMHVDFLNKVLMSAQEAVARAIRAEAVMKFGRIQITLFFPSERALKGQSWGFFRVEKIMDTLEGAMAPARGIEFYLYLEGQ